MSNVDYHSVDVKRYANSHELWAALSDKSKAKLRRQHRGLNDNGIRNRIWRRRNWAFLEIPKMQPCNCGGKLHKASCANAVHNKVLLYGQP